MLVIIDSFNSFIFPRVTHTHTFNHYAFWLRKQIPNKYCCFKIQSFSVILLSVYFFFRLGIHLHTSNNIVLFRLTIYFVGLRIEIEIWAKTKKKKKIKTTQFFFFWLCFAICVFSPENCFVLIKYCPILIKAWYTDPDLNTLDLTGTHNNQAQNSSHHHLHSSTLGNSHTTPHTGSSNIAGTTQAVTATRTGSGKFSNENDSECSSVTSDSMPGG